MDRDDIRSRLFTSDAGSSSLILRGQMSISLHFFLGLWFMLLLKAQFETLSRSPCKDDALPGVKTSDIVRSSTYFQ